MPRSVVRKVNLRVLRELYEDDDLSISQIAKRFDLPDSTARSYLIAAGAELRTRADALKLAGPRISVQRSAAGGRPHTPETRAKIAAAKAIRDAAGHREDRALPRVKKCLLCSDDFSRREGEHRSRWTERKICTTCRPFARRLTTMKHNTEVNEPCLQ